MSIQLDTTRLSASAQTSAQDASPMQGTSKAVAALFGESSVSVTDGSATDLEALVARLKNESERTKFSLLLTSLSSIGQSLNETEKRTLEQCLSLFEKLETLDGNAEKYSTELANEKAAALLLQTQIDALSKQIEQAVADGKAHNELVIEVTNLWVNRLIGDAQPKCRNRITFTDARYYAPDAPLEESGLMGPVELMEIN